MKNDLPSKIKQIELNYSVETIEYKGVKIWPFIRHAIFSSYSFSGESIVRNHKPRNGVMVKIGQIFQVLKTTSLSILLKKNAAVLFTDDAGSELRNIDGKLVDIFALPVSNFEKNIIPIVIKTRSASITAFPQYINSLFFSILMKLCSYIKRLDGKLITNRHVLDKIILDLQIEFDINKYILTIYSFIIVFRLYFKLIRPTRIFLVCYYDMEKMAASYVAKKMNIPVIELQHGVIHNAHIAYVTNVSIDPNPYPDYLFCFGEGFKKWVSPYICIPEHVFIIGNYYIDFIKKNKNKNKNFFLKKYSNIEPRIIITVASQVIFDVEILKFIEKIVEFCKDVYFIYIPRIKTPLFIEYSHENISIETDLDVYQCMQNSHITSTVHSTCAIESLVLGTPVILLNIQNLAKMVFLNFFSQSDAVFYADTPEEYISCLSEALIRNRSKISSDAINYYANNPKECSQKALAMIENDIKPPSPKHGT
jgi:predicted glycosyltransferase